MIWQGRGLLVQGEGGPAPLLWRLGELLQVVAWLRLLLRAWQREGEGKGGSDSMYGAGPKVRRKWEIVSGRWCSNRRNATGTCSVSIHGRGYVSSSSRGATNTVVVVGEVGLFLDRLGPEVVLCGAVAVQGRGVEGEG